MMRSSSRPRVGALFPSRGRGSTAGCESWMGVGSPLMPEFPEHGLAPDELLAEMRQRKEGDADWRSGRTWSLVYKTDDDDVMKVLEEAYHLYLYENALNPFAFPSLREYEREVVDWVGNLLHAPSSSGGSMSSGGTESIFLGVQVARDRGRADRGITEPEVVLPVTAHPAFDKAAHYLGVELKKAPLRKDLRVDVDAMRELITDRTVLVVGSAPCYPYGVIDSIEDIAALAVERGVPCHVDACLGGFVLPFWERLGEPLPLWDFRVEGVTSISADVHKYGYAVKGASTILHRSAAALDHQMFLVTDWVGGIYGSMTTAGTRPAGPIAAAWAVLRHLGVEGYVRLTGVVRDTTRALQQGIEAIDGLHVMGEPDASTFAFGSDRHDVAAICDVMDERGWRLDRQPDSLHVIVMPQHARIVETFLADLAEAVATHGESKGKEARYA